MSYSAGLRRSQGVSRCRRTAEGPCRSQREEGPAPVAVTKPSTVLQGLQDLPESLPRHLWVNGLANVFPPGRPAVREKSEHHLPCSHVLPPSSLRFIFKTAMQKRASPEWSTGDVDDFGRGKSIDGVSRARQSPGTTILPETAKAEFWHSQASVLRADPHLPGTARRCRDRGQPDARARRPRSAREPPKPAGSRG